MLHRLFFSINTPDDIRNGTRQVPRKATPARIAERLATARLLTERPKPFSLHLTLGRTKGAPLRGDALTTELAFSFVADRIDLMESVLGPDGPTYTLRRSYPLSP